jgi:hypothetical protein
VELNSIEIEASRHCTNEVHVEFTLIFGSPSSDMGIVLEALMALREYLQEWEREQDMTAQERLDQYRGDVVKFPTGPGRVVEGPAFEGVSVPLNEAEPVEFEAPDPEEFAAGLRAAIKEAKENDPEVTSAAAFLSHTYDGDE